MNRNINENMFFIERSKHDTNAKTCSTSSAALWIVLLDFAQDQIFSLLFRTDSFMHKAALRLSLHYSELPVTYVSPSTGFFLLTLLRRLTWRLKEVIRHQNKCSTSIERVLNNIILKRSLIGFGTRGCLLSDAYLTLKWKSNLF